MATMQRASSFDSTLLLFVAPNPNTMSDDELKAAKKERRRMQLRASQARYAKKQRIHEIKSRQCVQELNDEIQALGAERQRHQVPVQRRSSPWSTVIEIFHRLERELQSLWHLSIVEEMKNGGDTKIISALEQALAPSNWKDKLHGVNAILEQFRRYSLYFGDPHLNLERVEELTSGIMQTTATLSLTVTESTLQRLFPVETQHELVGRRLRSNCLVSFFIDECTGDVLRLEMDTDLLRTFVQVLGSVEHTSIAFQRLVQLY